MTTLLHALACDYVSQTHGSPQYVGVTAHDDRSVHVAYVTYDGSHGAVRVYVTEGDELRCVPTCSYDCPIGGDHEIGEHAHYTADDPSVGLYGGWGGGCCACEAWAAREHGERPIFARKRKGAA
jgi:hypothetical protein